MQRNSCTTGSRVASWGHEILAQESHGLAAGKMPLQRVNTVSPLEPSWIPGRRYFRWLCLLMTRAGQQAAAICPVPLSMASVLYLFYHFFHLLLWEMTKTAWVFYFILEFLVQVKIAYKPKVVSSVSKKEIRREFWNLNLGNGPLSPLPPPPPAKINILVEF